jgi:threonine dehydrogenase-like Zn-dependent dehydrogenase
MAEKRIDVTPLITHRFPLAECNKAFEMMKNRTEFYNKVMLIMNREDEKND